MSHLIQSIIDYGAKFINYKMGAIAALFMGGIVGIINSDHGYFWATIAGLKQAIYTFLFGGLLIKILETIVIRYKNPWAAIILAAIIPSVITIILVYLVHSFKGTPKPFESTIPTIILAPTGFLYLAYKKRIKGKFI